jgi:hypothetical protein
MIEPRNCVLDGPDGRYLRQRWTAQQHDGNAERSRRRDLAVGRGPTAVLGDDHVDGVGDQQCPIVGLAERTTTGDIGCVRHRKRRINRLDAAHEIMMLWSSREDSNLALAECEKDVPRRFAECFHCRGDIGNFDPTVAGQRRPWRAPECEQGDARGRRGRGCIRGDDSRVGVRRVDESVDALVGEISRKAFDSAEAADPHWRGLRGGRSGAPGERDRYGEIHASDEMLRQAPRFSSAAENEDAPHVAR